MVGLSSFHHVCGTRNAFLNFRESDIDDQSDADILVWKEKPREGKIFMIIFDISCNF